MKQIFVSQSEKEMGRNRSNRKLIAILDGCRPQIPEMPRVTFCPHIDYCHIITNKKCLFGEGYVGCRVAKYYNKYGEVKR